MPSIACTGSTCFAGPRSTKLGIVRFAASSNYCVILRFEQFRLGWISRIIENDYARSRRNDTTQDGRLTLVANPIDVVRVSKIGKFWFLVVD